ncbi:MAG: hypothetical protein Q9202_006868 [Teloschistes flavicans]
MSTDSLALPRKNAGEEISALAENPLKHDLQDSDRDLLKTAVRKVGIHVTIGSAVGLALGAFLAFRIRRTRMHRFNAFRAHEKPTRVKFADKFADGREAIPDVTQHVKPTTPGNIAAYTLCGFGGLFLGGGTGLLTGSGSARRTFTNAPESRQRIENAIRRVGTDVLWQ